MAAHGFVVLFDVMAVTGVAAGDQHAVSPQGKHFSTKLGSTRPLHITRMILTRGEYLIRDVPAKSEAV